MIRFFLGLPKTVDAPACPTCGQACTYDCGTHRTIAKRGRQRASRYEIARGTPPAEVVRKLAELGHKVAYIEGEIEY